MSHKRREERRLRQTSGDGEIRWSAMLRAVVLSGGVALLVVAALVPSESAISGGTYAPLAAGWCLLLILWAGSVCCDERATIRIGWTEVVGVALVGWHSLAALLSLGQTNGRQALNAHWLILGYGLTAFLFRQTVRTAREARCLAVAMVWLATLLASLGLYQYFVTLPVRRLDFERNPENYLAANQINNETGSPEAQHFKDRVYSVEPLATFGLTNSLAGVLAPWLMFVLAVGYAAARHRPDWRTIVALGVVALLLAGCLILTKSRTAYLAVVGGLVLWGLFGGAGGQWRIGWRLPAAVTGIALVLGLVAIFLGGLDAEVLSEAPKSVAYRLEYWRATARMIAQFPVFGCGPGNFQEIYAAHKLPQASEMPADPHNFLLELWATAGTPAVMLLVGLMIAFAADLVAVQTWTEQQEFFTHKMAVAAPEWLVLAGAIIGLLLGSPIAAALGFPLEGISDKLSGIPAVWVLGFPVMAGLWWSLLGWMRGGELTLAAAVTALIVLLINLLAAGAIVFPAVISTMLVLVPISLQIGASGAQQPAKVAAAGAVGQFSVPGHLRLPRGVAIGLVLGSLLMAVTCLYTEYYPVLNGRRALSDAMYFLEVKDFRQAPQRIIAAAEADSLSPEPRQLLADLLLGSWQVTDSTKEWEGFVEAADAYRRLNPRYHLAWFARGNWYLTAWRKGKRQEDLKEAIKAYEAATARYPNHALYQAQLAWTLHLAGEDDLARSAAEKAHDLDQKMPHQELKLARRHVTDPDFAQKPPRTVLEESAEQTVERLRTASAEEKR